MNYGQANHTMYQTKQRPPEEYQHGGMLGGAEKAGETSPIQRSIECLDKDVAVLAEVLTVLSKRLSSVTKPQPDCANQQEGLAAMCSPLVTRIEGIDKRVRQITNSLQLQLEMLEL